MVAVGFSPRAPAPTTLRRVATLEALPLLHASLRDADIRAAGPWAEAHGYLHPASLRDGLHLASLRDGLHPASLRDRRLIALLRAAMRRVSSRLRRRIPTGFPNAWMRRLTRFHLYDKLSP